MEQTHLTHIGKNIKQLREYRNMTPETLGWKAGNTEHFIKEVEKGNIALSIDQLVKIAEVLNCVLDINFTPMENLEK